MELVTLTVATGKIDFRCNTELSEADRNAALEKLHRLTQQHPEISRVFVDVERDADPVQPSSYVAKGQIAQDGPDLLASVADTNPLTAVEFLLDNFIWQLRRHRSPQVRVKLRAPKSSVPSMAPGMMDRV